VDGGSASAGYAPHADSRHCGAVVLVNPRDSAPTGNRDQGTSFVGIPMESEQKNSYLFYFIITLILLGFIASLALPLKAQEHRLSDAGPSATGDNVTDNLPVPATATATSDRSVTAH
jgi:hypothetical protein